jgi:hypothetical protein
MAHYALLDENNVVVSVITGRDETEVVGEVSNWEAFYTAETGLAVVRTSYNTIGGQHLTGGVPFRKNYAGIGYTYDESLDAFIPPKPFESWVLNQDTCLWDSPVPYPTDGAMYVWDEETAAWVEVINETD